MAESVTAGIILTPLALFGLFSKKKRDTFGVQYKTGEGASDSLTIMVKKKYGMAMRSILESVSGINVEFSDPANKK